MNKTSALHLSLVRNKVNGNVDSKLKQYKELEFETTIKNQSSAQYVNATTTTC